MAAEETWDAIVVGGGAAGLAALGALHRRGLRAVMLEQADAPGGVWRQCDYPGLALHARSFGYRFHNHPAAGDGRAHATRREVLDYFGGFIAGEGLAVWIRCGVRVTRIVSIEDGAAGWRCEVHAQTADGESRVWRGRFAVCALGFSNAGVPSLPGFAGVEAFGGTVLHSADVPATLLPQLQDNRRRVCLLGGGKSAFDIAGQIVAAGLAGRMTWVYETPLWGLNHNVIYGPAEDYRQQILRYRQYLFGVRRFPHAPKIAALAEEIAGSGLLLNLEPDRRDIWATRGAIYRPEDMQTLRAKTDRVRGRVAQLEPGMVRLEDGRAVAADMLICCTGYRRAANLPVMQRQVAGQGPDVVDPREQPLLYRGMIDPDLPCVVLFTGELLFAHQLFSFSVAAEWLATTVGRGVLDVAAMQAAIVQDDAALNRRVADGFGYRWAGAATRGQGFGYWGGEASMRYWAQILTDLRLPADIGERLYASMFSDPSGFDAAAREIAASLAAAAGAG